MTVQRNSLRGRASEQPAFPNFLEKQVAFSHPKHFKKTTQMRGTSPDPNGVNYARPLEVKKAKRF
jgi:hypothetical protein